MTIMTSLRSSARLRSKNEHVSYKAWASSDDASSGQESSQQEDSDHDTNDGTSIRNATSLPKVVAKSYTYQDLRTFLRDECPYEWDFIPRIDMAAFLSWTGPEEHLPFPPASGKLLRDGRSDSTVPTLSQSVYIYISGEGNNNIAIIGDIRDGYSVLGKAQIVQASKPFWYLFELGRVYFKHDTSALRALTCFLFLAAGLVETVGHYRNFLDDLRDAITTYAHGVEAELQECTGPAISKEKLTASKNALVLISKADSDGSGNKVEEVARSKTKRSHDCNDARCAS